MFPDTLSPEAQALAQAMLWGDRSLLTPEVVHAMRTAGMSHLMAVSGLHVGILMSVVWALLWPIERLILLMGPDRMAVYYWTGRIKRLAVVGVVAAYVWRIGAPASAVRAALILCLTLMGWMLQRPTSAWRCLGLAALILLAWDPWSAGQPGFQLSFLAVAGILSFSPWLQREVSQPHAETGYRLPGWFRLVLLSVSAQWFTTPVVAYWFHQVPVLGWVQGLLVVPLMPLLMTLLLSAHFMPGLSAVTWGVELLTAWMGWVAHAIGRLEQLLLGGHLVLYPSVAEVIVAEILLVAVILSLRWTIVRRNAGHSA